LRHSPGTVDGATARSFVSRFLLARLAAGPIRQPERHAVRGALLLSDIEAFTAHVEGLAQRGGEGLEEVITGFNRYFAAVAKAVHSHGGDILTIAGDSFLCWWPANGEQDLASAVTRAAEAGLAVMAAVAKDSAALPTRIGIAAGEATIAIAGGVDGRWELLPSGPAVADVASCEQDASPGAVLLSAEAARALADRADFRETTGGRAPPPGSRSTISAWTRRPTRSERCCRPWPGCAPSREHS